MVSIHDNEIILYEVNLNKSKIKFQTLQSHQDSAITYIEFIDVFAHEFETPLKGSILLDISTSEISQFLQHNQELLAKQKSYGWPIDYTTNEELITHLQKENLNYYIISASYGLSGWVVAKRYEIYQ